MPRSRMSCSPRWQPRRTTARGSWSCGPEQRISAPASTSLAWPKAARASCCGASPASSSCCRPCTTRRSPPWRSPTAGTSASAPTCSLPATCARQRRAPRSGCRACASAFSSARAGWRSASATRRRAPARGQPHHRRGRGFKNGIRHAACATRGMECNARGRTQACPGPIQRSRGSAAPRHHQRHAQRGHGLSGLVGDAPRPASANCRISTAKLSLSAQCRPPRSLEYPLALVGKPTQGLMKLQSCRGTHAGRRSRPRIRRRRPARRTRVIAEALAPVQQAVPQEGDAKQRLHELVDRTYSRFAEYEPHMRAALQLALEHQSLEAAGLLEEEPFRLGQRTEILATTIAPLKSKLKPAAYQRLLKALAVVYGIEPMVILKDICGASDRETEAVVRWMMDALVDSGLRQAQNGR